MIRIYIVTIMFPALLYAVIFPENYFSNTNARRLGFVEPNEHNSQDSMPIFENAVPGALISVGTERALFQAGYMKNPTNIVMVDVDDDVVKYNRYNIVLLKLSKNREDYLFLRTQSTQENLLDILNSNEKFRSLTEEQAKLLRDPESFRFWHIYQNKSALKNRDADPNLDFFYYLNTGKTIGKNNYLRHGDKIYLRDDEVFKKIKQLADDDKIEAHRIDISDDKITAQLFKMISAKTDISILDISNAWQSEFVQKSDLQSLVDNFLSSSKQDSFLSISSRPGLLGATWPIEQAEETKSIHWGYAAFTSGYLKKFRERASDFSRDQIISGSIPLEKQAIFIDGEPLAISCNNLF